MNTSVRPAVPDPLLTVVFEQASIGIGYASLDGRFLEVNHKFAAIFGYPREELLRIGFRQITHPDDLELTADYTRRLSAGELDEHVVEKRYVRKDGEVIWCRTNLTMHRDELGRPVHYIGAVEDVTAQKAAELALRDEATILELLNSTGRMLGSTLDREALLQGVTDAATKLTGAAFGAFFHTGVSRETGEVFMLYTLSGAPREAFDGFGHPRATALFGPTFRGEPPIRIDDVRADPRYGQWAPHHGMPPGHLPVRSYLAVPVVLPSGEVLGGLFFGHHERARFTARAEKIAVGIAAQAAVALDNARLYEEARRAAAEREALLEAERAARSEAERMSRMKDDFLATLSHELRTPLNAILGWTHILQSGRASAEDTERGVETIARNARAQAQLIEDLLDMSRILAGKARLDVQNVDLCDVLESALASIRPSADSREITLACVFDSGAAGSVRGDPQRLQQVFWNLLTNAVKFTPKGGRIRVTVERRGSRVAVMVEDSGIGIPKDFLPHVFDRFRQADASTTRRFGGLGLGLALVKSLTELHGGTVAVASEGEGRGTTFTVELPVSAVGTPSRRMTDGDELEPMALDGTRVLVLDDEEDARSLLAQLLGQYGAVVTTASTAEEALDRLTRDTFDVIVSDIGMPGRDGYDFIRALRRRDAREGGRTPAIALTAFARSEDRTRAMLAGFQLHLSKPIEPPELLAGLARLAGG